MLIYKKEIPLPVSLHTLLNIIFDLNKNISVGMSLLIRRNKNRTKKKPKIVISNLVRLSRISSFIFAKWKSTFTVLGFDCCLKPPW